MDYLPWLTAAAVGCALGLQAQTNPPARLALLGEFNTGPAADVLTAELSQEPGLHLLERSEIDRIQREQGLSAQGTDALKLGRLLGADGLLLLETIQDGTNRLLTVRLAAVKPGVVIGSLSSPRPKQDLPEWSQLLHRHFGPLFPKLNVASGKAVPLSVVNLRSALHSAEAMEQERQLTSLAIERLTHEPELFVLERRRLHSLAEEKAWSADDSSFWTSSYLLEGTIDPTGYSRETVTLNARLTPPKGGSPLTFDVSGPRTNLPAIVHQLATQVTRLLKINPVVKDWKPGEEATRFREEARWALKWGRFAEAQAAAEAAWALGNHDAEGAALRIQAYVLAVPETMPPKLAHYRNGKPDPHYVSVLTPPDPKLIPIALSALRYYESYVRTATDGGPDAFLRVPKVDHTADPPGVPGAGWYEMGVDALTAASQVLEHFHFAVGSQPALADALAELRSATRAVAELIARAPSVRDSYYVGDRIATHDELAHTIQEDRNLFVCQAKHGCFWQETPEDGLVLYRTLMRSPVFTYVHNHVWLREGHMPRLAAWTNADRQRAPGVWRTFVRELAGSPNVLHQLEARAFALADAEGDPALQTAFTQLFDAVFAAGDALVTNHVEQLYLKWGLGNLMQAKAGSGVVTPTRESVSSQYSSQYWPRLDAMEREYWSRTVPGVGRLATFEKQKAYLKQNKPLDPSEFSGAFPFQAYTKEQALELEPLIATYKSNQLAQAQARGVTNQAQLMATLSRFRMVETMVQQALNPPAPRPQTSRRPPGHPTAGGCPVPGDAAGGRGGSSGSNRVAPSDNGSRHQCCNRRPIHPHPPGRRR